MPNDIKETLHGTTCYPGGRRIEVMSPHPQWTQWAVDALYKSAKTDTVAADLLAACKVALANLAPQYASDHLVIKSLATAIARAERSQT
jgi:hypothetical protein